MKKKYFLRGLGVGVLVATLVLCISYRSQDSEQTVIQKAKELGMVFPEKTPDTILKPSSTPGETASGTAAKATNDVTKEPTAKPKDTKSGNVHTFTVRSGLLSSSVAREMKEAGIIKDADAFDEYLEKSGMGRKVLAGKYKIPIGASYEQIAKIITRQD